MEDKIAFRLELIGGPYDGEPNLGWIDDGEDFALPELLGVGRCRGYGQCGPNCPKDRQEHVQTYDARRHAIAPVGMAAQYTRVESDPQEGWARYVHADLCLDNALGALVGAGSRVREVV